jgi:hypothetical protein
MTMPTEVVVSEFSLASVDPPLPLLPPLLAPLLLGWEDASSPKPPSKRLVLSSELPHATVAALTPTPIASRQND